MDIYNLLERRHLRALAKERLGNVLNDSITDEGLREEMRVYDRFMKSKGLVPKPLEVVEYLKYQ